VAIPPAPTLPLLPSLASVGEANRWDTGKQPQPGLALAACTWLHWTSATVLRRPPKNEWNHPKVHFALRRCPYSKPPETNGTDKSGPAVRHATSEQGISSVHYLGSLLEPQESPEYEDSCGGAHVSLPFLAPVPQTCEQDGGCLWVSTLVHGCQQDYRPRDMIRGFQSHECRFIKGRNSP